MNCSCGHKLKIVETRCENENVFRLRWCPKCYKEIATQESIVDLDYGKKKLYKILYDTRHKKG